LCGDLFTQLGDGVDPDTGRRGGAGHRGGGSVQVFESRLGHGATMRALANYLPACWR
jgi:hypothetical protein